MSPGFKLILFPLAVAALALGVATCARAESTPEQQYVNVVARASYGGAVAVVYGYWHDVLGRDGADKVLRGCLPAFEVAAARALNALPKKERTVGEFASDFGASVAITVQESCLRGASS